MKTHKLISLGLGLLLAAGCSNPTIPDPDAEEAVFGSGADDGMDASTGSLADSGMGEGEFFEDEFAEELTMVIYFDFDQSELRAEYADSPGRTRR